MLKTYQMEAFCTKLVPRFIAYHLQSNLFSKKKKNNTMEVIMLFSIVLHVSTSNT